MHINMVAEAANAEALLQKLGRPRLYLPPDVLSLLKATMMLFK
jgi:hypothetical protein